MTVLIVINPNSGAKKSGKYFQLKLLPFLEDHKIDYKIFVTDSSSQIANAFPRLQESDCVIFISGDGTLFRALNALYSRDHMEIPFMIFPGGTENGIYESICSTLKLTTLPRPSGSYISNCLSAYMNEKTRRLNSFLLHLPVSNLRLKSLLLVSFGMLSDVDVMSGRTAMRPIKIPLTALRLLLSNPYVNDEYKIMYKPGHPHRPIKPFLKELKSSHSPAGWETIVGKFCAVAVTGHSKFGKSAGTLKGFSSFGGGAILFLVPSKGKWDKLRYLCTAKNPDMDSFDNIAAVEVTEFRIFPPDRPVTLCIDGEVFPSQPVHGECHPHKIYA